MMNEKHLKQILDSLSCGEITSDDALCELASLPFIDLGVAKHDSHRPIRNGFVEVIFCKGKTITHLIDIVSGLSSRKLNVFATKADEWMLDEIEKRFPEALVDRLSGTFSLLKRPVEPMAGKLAILCAGTADLPIAEEARITAQFYGIEAKKFYDVGVAGIHRLLKSADELHDVDSVIVVAGMEGALPSVVGGLTAAPIIAVPTSIGYGANFGGISALLGMLNSCSEGITVVNIDNGFGAACAALRIIRKKYV
jgi:hypothetical protein